MIEKAGAQTCVLDWTGLDCELGKIKQGWIIHNGLRVKMMLGELSMAQTLGGFLGRGEGHECELENKKTDEESGLTAFGFLVRDVMASILPRKIRFVFLRRGGGLVLFLHR